MTLVFLCDCLYSHKNLTGGYDEKVVWLEHSFSGAGLFTDESEQQTIFFERIILERLIHDQEFSDARLKGDSLYRFYGLWPVGL